MRSRLIKWWICLPILALVFHWIAGSSLSARDNASSCLSRGQQLEAQGDWASAVKEYERGMQELPAHVRFSEDRAYLQLARQRARVRSGQIVDALQQIKLLRDEVRGSPGLLADVRRELAVTSYYVGWLLRREGVARDKWEPFAEAARQDFRHLVEQSAAAPDQTNLEQVLHFIQSSDDEFGAKGLPEAALASNQAIGDAVADAKQEQSPQSGRGGGQNRQEREEPGRSGGAARITQRGS